MDKSVSIDKKLPNNWILISFGSSKTWIPALKRISRSITNERLELAFIPYDNKWLEKSIYWQELEAHVQNEPKGYGLWVWKPLILLDALNKNASCSGIIYLDAGCELNFNQKSKLRLNEYLNLAIKDNITAFELPTQERDYTYPWIIDRVFPNLPKDIPQISATAFFMKNCPENRSLLLEWYSEMNNNNFKNIKSSESNDFRARRLRPSFITNRHDQSILSLLLRKYGVKPIPDETYWYPNWIQEGIDYPIWATRNRTSIGTNSFYIKRKWMRYFFEKLSTPKLDFLK